MQRWYAIAETEFTHLRGVDAKPGDKFSGRASPPAFAITPADRGATCQHIGSTPLSMTWRAVAQKLTPTTPLAAQRR